MCDAIHFYGISLRDESIENIDDVHWKILQEVDKKRLKSHTIALLHEEFSKKAQCTLRQHFLSLEKILRTTTLVLEIEWYPWVLVHALIHAGSIREVDFNAELCLVSKLFEWSLVVHDAQWQLQRNTPFFLRRHQDLSQQLLLIIIH